MSLINDHPAEGMRQNTQIALSWKYLECIALHFAPIRTHRVWRLPWTRWYCGVTCTLAWNVSGVYAAGAGGRGGGGGERGGGGWDTADADARGFGAWSTSLDWLPNDGASRPYSLIHSCRHGFGRGRCDGRVFWGEADGRIWRANNGFVPSLAWPVLLLTPTQVDRRWNKPHRQPNVISDYHSGDPPPPSVSSSISRGAVLVRLVHERYARALFGVLAS